MTPLTIYIAIGAIVLVGGTLMWARLQDLLIRIIAFGSMVFFASLAVAEAHWIADTLGGEGRYSESLANEAEAGSIIREVLALDPTLDPAIVALVERVASDPAERASLQKHSQVLGDSLVYRIMPRLLAADDEHYQVLVTLIARLADHLPADPSSCRAMLTGRDLSGWFALERGLPGLEGDATVAIRGILDDARERPPVMGLNASQKQYVMQQVMLWVGGLPPQEMAVFGILGGPAAVGSAGAAAPDVGSICGVVRSLARHLDALPPPAGGQLLRTLFIFGLEQAHGA